MIHCCATSIKTDSLTTTAAAATGLATGCELDPKIRQTANRSSERNEQSNTKRGHEAQKKLM